MTAVSQTVFRLAAMYEGRPLVPIEEVCRDFFAPLPLPHLVRKLEAGEILLPVTRVDPSQKSPRFVAIDHLATYLDDATATARENHSEWLSATKGAVPAGGRFRSREGIPLAYFPEQEIKRLPRLDAVECAVGVYYLFDADKCVYVGQSRNVFARVASHRRNKTLAKIFDTFSWIPCAAGRLNEIERYYIRSLRPKYNFVGIGPSPFASLFEASET